MPIAKKIISFLDKNKVKYEKISHRKVFTAYDKAATLKVKPNIIGKTLILKIDNELAMVLVPGNKNLDKNKLKKSVNLYRKKQKLRSVKNLDFISEKLMKNKLKGVKVGAVPPFGNLWSLARRGQRPGGGFPTFVEKSLLKNSTIIVSAGNYNVSIKINSNLFKKLIPDLAVGNFGKKK